METYMLQLMQNDLAAIPTTNNDEALVYVKTQLEQHIQLLKSPPDAESHTTIRVISQSYERYKTAFARARCIADIRKAPPNFIARNAFSKTTQVCNQFDGCA
jgi:hypothetical protein